MTPKFWTLNSYVVDTMTDIAVIGADGAVLKTVLITNTSAASATVDLVITDNVDTEVFTLVPGAILEAGNTYTLDVQAVGMSPNSKVRGQVDIAGVEFLVSGAE